MSLFGGGDLVELKDGRQGRIHATIFNLRDGSCQYKVTNNTREPDLIDEAAISHVVEYGRHDYQVSKVRGHCVRCGVAKKLHS